MSYPNIFRPKLFLQSRLIQQEENMERRGNKEINQAIDTEVLINIKKKRLYDVIRYHIKNRHDDQKERMIS